jgi:cyclin A
MSIQIYHDAENIIPSDAVHGKKSKRADFCSADDRSRIPKPCKTKRIALSTISQNQNAACRVQPSRAAKGRQRAGHCTKSGILNDIKPGFSIYEDDLDLLCSKDLVEPKDSPMVFSPPAVCETMEDVQDASIIEDIDSKSDPLLCMPEYAADVHSYLKIAERKYRPKPNYMRKQADINPSMRSVLIDWLVEVAQEYKLKEQTLYLTINYIDRFLSFMSVQRSKLQLVGAACMLVAAKFEEIYPPEVKEFVYITDDTYTAKQVLKMEHLILKTLSFDLSVPTCRDFITRYLVAADAPPESRQQYLSEYLCELTVIDFELSVKYTPSMLAAASILVANIMLSIPTWSRQMEHYTEFKIDELCQCAKDICAIYRESSTLQQQTIQSKYKSPKFGCVAENTNMTADMSVLDQFG